MKRLILAAAAVLSLAACATETPYQPMQARGVSNGGYTDSKVSSDRFRVSFQGNTITDRETVERYLLYRAAEVTREAGYDWFAMAERDTEKQHRQYLSSGSAWGYGGWYPNWYYRGYGGGWYGYDPFFYGSHYDYHVMEQYRATAEILLGKGEKPANDPGAFDARDVMANIGPTLRLPDPAKS